MSERRAWMVRAGNDNELTEQFEQQGWVAIGWSRVGDLSGIDSRSAVKERYVEAHPKHSAYKAGVNAGQLHRFANVIEEGDLVLSYDKSIREYLVGTISSEYKFEPTGADADYPHVRRVEWDEHVDRDKFSRQTKNTLGSVLTLFSLDDVREELGAIRSGEEVVGSSEEADPTDEQPPFYQEIESQSEELISDHVAHIDAEQMEELTAAILRAMDYTAQTTGIGADHGIDVVAHPDSFGFEDPVIKVQVKHRESKTGSSDVRDFIGTLSNSEKGLFVSTGGYTNSAEEEAARTDKRITLIDRDRFIELLLGHYEEIEPEYTNLIPLKRVYVPTEEP